MASNWIAVNDKATGLTFFCDESTGQSVWDLPPGVSLRVDTTPDEGVDNDWRCD